jgi:hypothetical protein
MALDRGRVNGELGDALLVILEARIELTHGAAHEPLRGGEQRTPYPVGGPEQDLAAKLDHADHAPMMSAVPTAA